MKYKQPVISSSQWVTAWEVFKLYEGVDREEFIDAMEDCARDTDHRFVAYVAAHAICAKLASEKR